MRSTLLLTAANLSLRSVSLLFQVYLSGIIGAVGMGKMQLMLTAGGFAMTLGLSGIRVAAMNLTARYAGSGDYGAMKKATFACLRYGLCCSAAAGALLILLANPIAGRFVKDGSVSPALRLLGAGLPISCLTAVLGGWLTAQGRIRRIVVVEVLERAVCIALTVVMLSAWKERGTAMACCAVIGGSTAATAMTLIIHGVSILRELRTIPVGRESVKKPLLSLCLPLALSDYLRSGLSTLEQFLIPFGLAKFAGDSTAAMGDYGTVSAMVFPVLMFPAALFYSLSDLLVPELSRCRAQGRTVRIRCLTARCLRIGLVFSAMVAGLLYLLAPSLGLLLYGSENAGRYLRIFAPLVLMLYPDALTDGMLKGLGEQVASVRYNTLSAAADVVLLFLLLPRWGMGGFVFTFTVTHGVNFFLSLRRLMTVTDFAPDWQHWARTLLTAIFAVAFCLRVAAPTVHYLSLVLCGGIYLAVFFLLCLPTNTFRLQELIPFANAKNEAR